ncbi:hypothetical protein HNQ57_003563 [Zhongshania antarctica]|uniref:Metal-dependent hydrolase n=1 Tax=Zhongshania antarctica TaxID=641702 RepID=A0A840RA99_9GAMM|nr:metal-dependent hydrolase [Zhongshania antarctica]MBB5189260.1 hypothetical protein [Zhongshania antarctica]
MNYKLTDVSSTASQTPFDIPIRKDLRWDFSNVPVDFVKGRSPLIGYFWAAFSMAAPPVESFFIKALLPTLETIENDEKLLQDCRDMIKQEAQHSSVHRKLNQHLEKNGYDVESVTKIYDKVIEKVTEGLTAVDMMGVAAAGEHSLYSFAQVWHENPEFNDDMHEQAARVFHWHFLEEAEHGAVSHDQYLYFGKNNYWHRLKMAFRSRHLFYMFDDAVNVIAEGFGCKPTLRDRWDLFYYKWFKPGIFRMLAFRFMEYLSPRYSLTFDHDDIQTMKRWNDNLYASQPPEV